MTEKEKKTSKTGIDVVPAGTKLPVQSSLLVSVSESIASTAERLYENPAIQNLQEFSGSIPAWRIAVTFRSIEKRIVEESIEANPERLVDLLEKAIPFVGRASTKEKRAMMEEVILNGVRKSEDASAQVEANYALALIDELPDSALLIFAAIVAEVRATDSWFLEKPFPDLNLPKTVVDTIEIYLSGKISDTKSIFHGLGDETPNGGRSIVEYHSPKCKLYCLNSRYHWLTRWIEKNSS